MATATRTVKVRFDGQAKGLEQAAKDGEKSVGKWKAGVAKIGAAAAAAAAVAGAAVSAALVAGISKALDKSKVDALLAAKVGLPPDLAKQMGKVSGNLYANGFADSIESGADAIKAVWQNHLTLEDATREEVEKVAGLLLTLQDVIGEDADRISGTVKQLMRTGMVRSTEEAFDLLVRAQQEGINKAGDLLDTLNEYPTQFRKLGLSGPDALGLIAQAMRAGARDSDIAADALKEFSIRAVDGSKLTAEGFKALGLDGKKMAADIGAGGKRAATALDLTLDRLRGIKDPVKRSQAAVALFGTQAEDLGAALEAMDLTGAAEGLGKVQGAAQRASDTLGESFGARFDTMKRKLEVGLTGAATKVLGALDKLAQDPEIREWARQLGEDIRALVDVMLPKIKESWEGLVKAFKDHKEEIALALKIVVAAGGGLIKMLIDGFTRTITVIGLVVGAFRTLVDKTLTVLGTVVNAAAVAFGWIPGLGPKLKEAAEKFDDFARAVRASLGLIPSSRTLVLNVSVRGGTANTRDMKADVRAHGGPVLAGRTYLVGEQGPELLTMGSTSGRVIPNGQTMAALGGGGPEVIELRLDLGHGIQQVVEVNLRERDRRLRRRAVAMAGAL
jgi:hypothetical protein